MNQDFSFSLSKNFNLETLAFNKIPSQSKLFLDFQNNVNALAEFYPKKGKKVADIAKEVLDNYKINREELCDILVEENVLYETGKKTLDNIENLREKDCVAVFTGQQAGLFSGPVYTIYKALSAIKLAEDLKQQGIKAVPIFWIASEDHDFEEISKTSFINKERDLFVAKNSPKDLVENAPVGFTKIDSTIDDSIRELFNSIEKTEFTKELESLLKQTYKSGETFSKAFGKLLASVFKDYGLIFISPLNERLRNLCSPIFIKAIEKSNEITESLLKQDKELKEKGYHSQVLVEKDFFTLFFIDKENKRNALRFNQDGSKVISQNAKYEFSKEDLIEIAKNTPQHLSPNALMRPIVQDYLFPTVCYFGGAAEIAYFAQNSAIYKILNRPITQIQHRSSFTIIEASHRRTLNKYELNIENLFAGKEKILTQIVEKYLNPNTSKTFDETAEFFEEQLNKLNEDLIKSEQTLSVNLENRRKKIFWHIESLRKKFHRAEVIKNEVINRRIEDLFTAILPKDVLQERNLNALYFINQYGENFIKWLYNSIDSEEKGHQIIIF